MRCASGGLLVLGLLSLGCGVQIESEPAVEPPLHDARISTYGWSRLMGLGQEVWVTLMPRVQPGQVVDLRPFGPFRPGVTDAEAFRLAGPPARVFRDRYGEPWFEYPTPGGIAQIGECSGDGEPPTTCLWRLYATYSSEAASRALHPQLVRLAALARGVPEPVKYRTLQINTADNSQFVTFPLDTSPRVLWHDRLKSILRPGCQKAE
jgi:hypothetical protein